MVVLVLLVVGWPLVMASVLLAFVHIRLGPKAVIQSLAVVVIIKFLNDAIYDFPPMLGLQAWALLLAAAGVVAGRFKRQALSVLLPLWSFAFVVAALTPFASANPAVTWFKLGSFVLGTTTIVVASYALSDDGLRALRRWLPSVALAVALVSIATFPFAGIAYQTAPGLFQGILNQSQAFGAFLAPLMTLVCARWLFRRSCFTKTDGALLLIVAILLLATNARTAAIAVLLGIVGSLLLGFVRDRRSRTESLRGFLLASLLGVLGAVATLANQQARDAVVAFVFKYNDGVETTSSVEDAFMTSRGAGIASHWQNFLKHPLTGTGFGVYPRGTDVAPPVTVFGIPISSPVEKGFLPTAVLEEVGIPGALAFLLLVAALVRQAHRAGDSVWLAVLLTCLFVNLGEAVFFSMGGLGLLFWIWIGLALRSPEPAADAATGATAVPAAASAPSYRLGENILR